MHGLFHGKWQSKMDDKWGTPMTQETIQISDSLPRSSSTFWQVLHNQEGEVVYELTADDEWAVEESFGEKLAGRELATNADIYQSCPYDVSVDTS